MHDRLLRRYDAGAQIHLAPHAYRPPRQGFVANPGQGGPDHGQGRQAVQRLLPRRSTDAPLASTRRSRAKSCCSREPMAPIPWFLNPSRAGARKAGKNDRVCAPVPRLAAPRARHPSRTKRGRATYPGVLRSATRNVRLGLRRIGRVVRSKANYGRCKFRSGKEYDCDLSAAQNIAARYFVRRANSNNSMRKPHPKTNPNHRPDENLAGLLVAKDRGHQTSPPRHDENAGNAVLVVGSLETPTTVASRFGCE